MAVSFPLFGVEPDGIVAGRGLELHLLHAGTRTLTRRWDYGHFIEPFWRIYCNLDDGMRLTAGGRSFPLRAGVAYVIPAWIDFAGRGGEGVRHIVVHADLVGPPRSVVESLFREIVALPGGMAAGLIALADTLGAADAADPLHQVAAHRLAWEAIGVCIARLPAERRRRLLGHSDRGELRPALEHIERNLHRPIANSELAHEAGVSESHLVRLFRQRLGTSPARWVSDRRLRLAGVLLTTTALPIVEIAGRCGFPDRHYFTRVFSARHATSPAVYRARRIGGGKA